MNKKGFTLIEIMLATAVLALGVISVHQTLFTALSGSSSVFQRLDAFLEAGNKIWQTEELVRSSSEVILPETGGTKSGTGKAEYAWILRTKALDAGYGVYDVQLEGQWRQQDKQLRVVRYGCIAR